MFDFSLYTWLFALEKLINNCQLTKKILYFLALKAEKLNPIKDQKFLGVLSGAG